MASRAFGAASEVELSVKSFGLGGEVRPGDWTGIVVEFTDSADKPRAVMIRLELPDPDGDTAELQRTVTTNPGERQAVWLYARLPFRVGQGDTFTFTAHEAVEAGTTPAPDAHVIYTAGRLLGSTTYLVQTTPSPYDSHIAVVGTHAAGLDQFTWQLHRASDGFPRTGHELVDISKGLTPGGLPDRWMGLASFTDLVWTGAGSAEQPVNLRDDQADAIREWVRRGGHLIVVLPAVAQTWVGNPGNKLADILPLVKADRHEGVDLNAYRDLLTRDREAVFPKNAIAHTFDTKTLHAGAFDAMPIMKGPDGETVVVRRLVGAGAVTLIGIDLASSKIGGLSLPTGVNGGVERTGELEADQFWNRVLGRRQELLTPGELDEQIKKSAWAAGRTPVEFDALINSQIVKSASAAAGVLLGFVVFVLYWLLAGPAGFYLLKARSKTQHAWVAFFLAGIVFTAVAWSGANFLKLRRVEGQHLTLLDTVYGQPSQRARSWVSLFLPGYGSSRVSVAPAAGTPSVENAPWHNALSAWQPQSILGPTSGASFPDARGYAMDARSPDAASFPTRATVKQIQLDWAGSTAASWGTITPAASPQTPVGAEITVLPRATTGANQRRWTISGVLTHSLPGALRDVTVYFVERPTPTRTPAGELPAVAFAGKLPSEMRSWERGEPLVLDKCFPIELTRSLRADEYFRRLRGEVSPLGIPDTARRDANEMLEAVSFFNLLPPPDRAANSAEVGARREATHAYDLSRWFTQPCIVVVGELEDAELPVPLRVDDLPAETVCQRVRGRTVVRWVYPLSPEPLKAAGVQAER